MLNISQIFMKGCIFIIKCFALSYDNNNPLTLFTGRILCDTSVCVNTESSKLLLVQCFFKGYNFFTIIEIICYISRS